MSADNADSNETDRPRVLDYAGDRFIRPRLDRVAFLCFVLLLPLFFMLNVSVLLIEQIAHGDVSWSLGLVVSKAAVAVIWSVIMFLFAYVPNRARRWELTAVALVVLNGEAERTVVPWSEVVRVTCKKYGVVVSATDRRKFALPGVVESDCQIVEQCWRAAKSER